MPWAIDKGDVGAVTSLRRCDDRFKPMSGWPRMISASSRNAERNNTMAFKG
jgi:hypothetical protein